MLIQFSSLLVQLDGVLEKIQSEASGWPGVCGVYKADIVTNYQRRHHFNEMCAAFQAVCMFQTFVRIMNILNMYGQSNLDESVYLLCAREA